METAHKKGMSLSPNRGRPARGALSTYPAALRHLIYTLRDQHEGWGAESILVELKDEYGYTPDDLPDISSINRYLHQEGFMPKREPYGRKPPQERPNAKRPHDLWEMDAQGAELVDGLGHIAMINIKDVRSRVYCMAFPVLVKSGKSQPKTIHYCWALRLAFEQWGMPKNIQVDKDSVFIDNTSKSPFPSRLHLFLMALGIELHFIDVPPPKKQSIVERSHQTLERQALRGQSYPNWKALFQYTNKRRKKLNGRIRSNSLGKKAPLVAFPKAKHSGRAYQVQDEQQLINLKKVYSYIAKCTWFRKISKSKTLALGKKIYYLKNAIPETQVQITFCNRRKKLIFRDENELILAILPIKGLHVEDISGGTTKELKSFKKTLHKATDFPL